MLNLKVDIDKNSGFCFGVVYAIEMAEEILDNNEKLYCLGDIVHNEEEVNRLTAKGLEIINHEDLENIYDAKVLIRAHGESPSTYKLAIEHNLELLDASCPVVLKLQERVRETVEETSDILIYGKHGHAEVIGLNGQTGNTALVFQDVAELEGKELPKKVALFSQTTKSTKNYYAVKSYLEDRGVEVDFNDTICRQVSNRDIQLRTYATKFDVIVFVSGEKSSNGKVLHKVCESVNPRSYFVSNVGMIDKTWFVENETVGIAGATSTPMWLMEDVKTALEKL